MKSFNLKQFAFVILGALLLSVAATGCSKNTDHPGIPDIKGYGTHNIDPQLQGEWMWTDASDGGHYDDNGTWQGGSYGFAFRMAVDAKGNGTLFDHVFSDLGSGSYIGVDIYYTGYYEMDDNGTLTFYAMSGRYKNSSGTDRALRSDELYNPATGTGMTYTFPEINFTTVGSREAFTTTSSGQTEAFYKQ